MNMFFSVAAMFYPLYFGLLLLFFLFVFLRSLPEAIKIFNKISLLDWILLAAITLIGLLLRSAFAVRTNLDSYVWSYIRDAAVIKNFFSFPFVVDRAITHAYHIPGYSFLISLLPISPDRTIISVSIFNIIINSLNIPLIFLVAYYYSRDKFVAFVASVMLAFSWLHIHYSAFEFPMPLSVFLVTLVFLYLLLWIEKKNKTFGVVFLILFIISINIKLENIVLLSFFIPVLVYQMTRDVIFKRQMIWALKFMIPIAVISCIITFRYFKNLNAIQHVPMNRDWFPGKDIFSLNSFWPHFKLFFVDRYRCGIFLLGYLCLRLDKKVSGNTDIICWWMVAYLPLLSYFTEVNAEWNMLVILIPVYILAGIVFVWLGKIFVKRDSQLYYLPIILSIIFAFILFGNRKILQEREYSWIELSDKLKNIGNKCDCFITYDIQTLGFSLPYIFGKEKRWLFFNHDDFIDKERKCKEQIYFFDPIPYGLQNEEKEQKVDEWGDLLRNKYDLEKVSDIELYKLRRKNK